ncbi:Trafficking protein particle complex subunit 2 [Astathelohania contejeani]|uniref:Trafficking protein particle complex subunit 2 n=1 Tax=Astathelohania contejeani TaxID=164912 RepID=A0ABQ7HXG8_9MICR|nr:Trafficking protein particle complex subunit 2 [Thelohania contejeani]
MANEKGELIIIINTENDIVYQKEFNIETEREYISMYLLAYASMDILDELVLLNNNMFYDTIGNQFGKKVSVFIMYCGFKIIYVNTARKSQDVYKFLDFISKKYNREMMEPFYDSDCMLKSSVFDRHVIEFYKRVNKMRSI